MEQIFSIQPSETKKAVLAGNDAMRQFGSRLKEAGAKVLEEVEKEALCGGAGVKTVSERCACQPQPAGAFDRVRRSGSDGRFCSGH